MKITDGKKTVKIEMVTWTGDGYSPDWSDDFFESGSLPYDEEKDAYIVDDVSDCIEYARDWEKSTGEFSEDEPNDNNFVFVEEDTEDIK